MESRFTTILLYELIPIIVIFSYGSYRCGNKTFKDPLEKKIVELDGWSMTHIIWNMLIGYLFPKTNELIIVFILGLLWELFEHYAGKQRQGWLGGYGDCNDLLTDNTKTGNWWYGKYSDIICNTIGLLLGSYIRKNKKLFIYSYIM